MNIRSILTLKYFFKQASTISKNDNTQVGSLTIFKTVLHHSLTYCKEKYFFFAKIMAYMKLRHPISKQRRMIRDFFCQIIKFGSKVIRALEIIRVKNSCLIQLYEIDICQIMIFRLVGWVSRWSRATQWAIADGLWLIP